MNYTNKFLVKPGSKVELNKIDASFKDKHESHEQALPLAGGHDGIHNMSDYCQDSGIPGSRKCCRLTTVNTMKAR